MAGSECDVCGGPSVGVASSALGAVSFAYCLECLQTGADCLGMVVYAIAYEVRPAEYLARVRDATLLRTNTTREEFDRMVAEERASSV